MGNSILGANLVMVALDMLRKRMLGIVTMGDANMNQGWLKAYFSMILEEQLLAISIHYA